MVGDTFLSFIDGVPHGIDVLIKRFIKVQNSLTHKLTNSQTQNSLTHKLKNSLTHKLKNSLWHMDMKSCT